MKKFLKKMLMKTVNWIKAVWTKFFRDSETLFWAFIQAVSGLGVYFYQDSILREAFVNMFKMEYAPLALVGMGLITFLARISRAKDL